LEQLELFNKINMIGFIIIALILFMCFNGLIIRWHNEIQANTKAMWSKWWHRCALAIRVCLWLSIWLITFNWFIFIGVIIVDSILYPILINLINGLKWNYIGTTSSIDKLIRKFTLWLKEKIRLK